MTTIHRRITEPVRAPVRRSIEHHSRFFEDLVHAVKTELVGHLESVQRSIDEVRGSLDTVSDQVAMQGASLRAVASDMERLHLLTGEAAARIDRVAPITLSHQLEQLIGSGLEGINGPAARFLNYAASWDGPLADAGLFINDPYLVVWDEGGVRLRLVNERIIEQPFVYASLADLPLGSRILDIGGGESLVGLSLASLGHDVTVVEPRGYPFGHPNLTVFEGPIEAFESAEPFDAVVLLSTIEHLGIGHYNDGTGLNPTADLEAMKVVAELIEPTGRLVMTVPYGPAEVTELERIYDYDGLQRLLDGWSIANVVVGRNIDDVTWEVESTVLDEPAGPDRVAMVIATLAGSAGASVNRAG